MKNSWTAERVTVLLCLTLFTIPFEERLEIETSKINESVTEQTVTVSYVFCNFTRDNLGPEFY